MGAPHRLRYFREALEHIHSRSDVVFWTGEQILEWYLNSGQVKSKAVHKEFVESPSDSPRVRGFVHVRRAVRLLRNQRHGSATVSVAGFRCATGIWLFARWHRSSFHDFYPRDGGGRAADRLLLARFSRKTVLQAGIAIFSAGTLFTVISCGFLDMLIYRAATGIGEAMQLTVLMAIAANYFVRHRAAAVGSINFSFGVGASSARFWVEHSWHLSELAGANGCLRLLRRLRYRPDRACVGPWFTEGETAPISGGSGGADYRSSIGIQFLTLMSRLAAWSFTAIWECIRRFSAKVCSIRRRPPEP